MGSQRVRHDWETELNWHWIVALQCCARFYCTAKWISCVCVCVFNCSLCPALCSLMDCSPPDSSVHRIFQARILEWVAISSSRGYSWPKHRRYIYIYIYIYPFFFGFPSHLGHHRALSRVPRAIYNKFSLVIYFIYSSIYGSSCLPIHPTPPSSLAASFWNGIFT